LIVRVVFIVRVYGICLRDEFFSRLCGSVYGSSFWAEFTGQAFVSSIFVMFRTLGCWLSFVSTFQPILQIRFTNRVLQVEWVNQSRLTGSNFMSILWVVFLIRVCGRIYGLISGLSCLWNKFTINFIG